ncbi:hypothetical protein FKM82_029998 [Ascaphus truei]
MLTTHIYFSTPDLTPPVQTKVSECLSAISYWMALRHLKLNMAKTELLILPPKPGPTTSFHITVGSTIIHPVAQARCLGVTLDSSLTFRTFLKPVAFSSAISQRYALSSVARLLKL